MNSFYGADTEALRDYAGRVLGGSSRLQQLREELAGTVTSVEWVGSDADAFRDDFTGPRSPSCRAPSCCDAPRTRC